MSKKQMSTENRAGIPGIVKNGVAAVVCLACSPIAAETRWEGPVDPFLGPPRMEVQQVFDYERHPNLVVTVQGTA